MGLEKTVEQVYRGRERMIIIGLTGRTGSGCTKVAEILQKENFSTLDLPDTKNIDYEDAEERKYKIIKDFMGIEGHWKSFNVIEMSSIILAAALEKGKDSFIDFLDRITSENEKSTINIGEKATLTENINEINYMFEEAKKFPLNIDKIQDKDQEEYYEFYTKTIREYKKSFKDILGNYTCFEVERSRLKGKQQKRYHLYTYLMQEMGNNLRSSGNPFEKNFCENKFRDFFKRVDNVIDIINKHTERIARKDKEEPSTRICIDAIRNPYEALYFKDKYRSFRLMAISTRDEDRRKRLKKLNDEELDNLDHVEYAAKSEKPEEVFYHQNIQGCLEVADIHVYNENIENGKFHNLTKQIIKYIALMLHPALVTPTHIERCMQLAYNAKYNSGCLSRQVGAVVTREDYSIQSIGWNDVPKGQVSCNLRDISIFCTNKDGESFSSYEISDLGFNSVMETLNTQMKGKACGRCKAFCFKDIYNGMQNEKNQVYTRSLHAEENAFLQISKYGGTEVKGGYLFTTASPCELCAKKAYQLGIKEIYYIDPYPGISQKHILTFGKNNNPQMKLFYGAIGTAYLDFYVTRIPVKDELEMLTNISVKDVAKGNIIKYDDLIYHSIEIEFRFVNSRSVIKNSRKACFTLSNNSINVIPKTIVWTGSTYDGTKLSNDKDTDSGITLEEQTGSMPHAYNILIDREKNKENVIHYKTITSAKDEKRVMEPYLAHMVKNKTEKLKLVLITPKEIVENVRWAIYADLSMNIKIEEGELSYTEKNGTKDINRYEFSPDVANVNYTYAIEWDFKE